MSLKDFELGKELGKGAFGSVSIVKRKEDGKTYAMKRVKIQQLGTKERENALNEVRILASLSHPNIIGYKEAFFDEDSRTLNIVMEIADDGDLESKVQKNVKSKGFFPEKDVWSYLVQITQGLKYLHDNKIMHRDLKCANIFLMKNGTLKLGDLNVSKIVKMGLAHTQTGTPYYASPEVWADKPYDYKSDVWSIACVIYELCALKPPFRGNSLEQLYRNVTKGVYDAIPSTYSKDLANVIGRMLQTNPNLRPSCDEILNNEIVIKRMEALKEGKDIIIEQQPIQLLNTIKLPRNMNEINQRLPKKKMYKQEMEEANLMNYDVNINKKQISPVIDLGRKEKDLIILEKESKETKDRDNNMDKNIAKEKYKPVYIQNNDNNYLINNNIPSQAKKDNNIVIRPSSAKYDNNKNQIQQPKTPVLLKPDINVNNINNKIYISNNNNQHVKSENRQVIAPASNRPQSAKVGANINNENQNKNNDYNNKINQIHLLNQIGRKNIISEPKKIVANNNPIVNNANNYHKKAINVPQSINDKVIISNNNQIGRPQSGRDKNIVMNNNGLPLRNERKVVIEKMNINKPVIQNPVKVIENKKNYHYNNNMNRDQIMVNNRNNFLNAIKGNDNNPNALNRGGINNQNNGPKIVYINQKK